MSIAMILKIFSDCCVCFAILCSGPVTFSVPALILALLMGIAAGLATFFEEKGWVALRRLCALLPFACLLLTDTAGQTLILALPAVYTAAVILRGKLDLEYSEFRYYFIRSLIVLGVAYAVVNIWIFLTSITSESVFQPNASVVLRYSLVHLFCGIVLQRQLRLGVGNRAEGGRRQLATLLGTAGAITVGFLAAEPLLRRSIGSVLRFLVSLILMPLVYLVEVVVRWIASLKSTEADKEAFEEFTDYWQNEVLGGDLLGGRPQQPSTQPEFDPTVLWTVLAVILALVAGLLLLRSFRKSRAFGDGGEQLEQLVKAPKRKKAPGLTPRARVRQLYRDFLRTEKSYGMKLQSCHTSADVLENIHTQTDRPSAQQLREVYLIARYDDRQTLSRSQVEQAKRALRGTKHSK